MARLVNEAAYKARRNAILDAALRAIEITGYEQMAIADLLSELHISSGAFYHYFDSKPALLLALVERAGNEAEQLVLPIVHDPKLGALDKLQRLFATLDQHKRAHKGLVLAFTRVWYADENAIFRHKLFIETRKRLSPWLSQIIQQGVAEGVFTTPYPEQAARMIIALLEDLGYAIAELLYVEEGKRLDFPRMVQLSEAMTDALERMLGAPPGSLWQSWRDDLARWQALLE